MIWKLENIQIHQRRKPLRSQTSMEKAKMIRRNIVCFTFDEFHDLSQKLLQLTGNVVISK